ncbi:uncharacterized protein L969DRAFT_53801 [Mixia osmundae IAM 14324]|uniref:BZIP domain-containing protein n=1 Tax=Mixia osmundae (strain CBS 9802 / IAM 14324 / JCM 22182 / KY 12970) TaxID=764103 RepID=G7EAY0_MIXOS|nr:uncharacterized protein L969DRAFT_53801 [Mixia osmundae IAM 14324]KEI37025.1 hypothetical protein L969DRAFT_53801 [Mixia osmundae IAM 14324]GAA99990.1 hypothetical protein E5Q_06693 [Mixia osmundae IAM 14324]
MAVKRGRKQDDTLPPSRSRDIQRAFRARRAEYINSLQDRVKELEEENDALRARLGMPPGDKTVHEAEEGKYGPLARLRPTGAIESYSPKTSASLSSSGMAGPSGTHSSQASPSNAHDMMGRPLPSLALDHFLDSKRKPPSLSSSSSHPPLPLPNLDMHDRVSTFERISMPPTPSHTSHIVPRVNAARPLSAAHSHEVYGATFSPHGHSQLPSRSESESSAAAQHSRWEGQTHSQPFAASDVHSARSMPFSTGSHLAGSNGPSIYDSPRHPAYQQHMALDHAGGRYYPHSNESGWPTTSPLGTYTPQHGYSTATSTGQYTLPSSRPVTLGDRQTSFRHASAELSPPLKTIKDQSTPSQSQSEDHASGSTSVKSESAIVECCRIDPSDPNKAEQLEFCKGLMESADLSKAAAEEAPPVLNSFSDLEAFFNSSEQDTLASFTFLPGSIENTPAPFQTPRDSRADYIPCKIAWKMLGENQRHTISLPSGQQAALPSGETKVVLGPSDIGRMMALLGQVSRDEATNLGAKDVLVKVDEAQGLVVCSGAVQEVLKLLVQAAAQEAGESTHA